MLVVWQDKRRDQLNLRQEPRRLVRDLVGAGRVELPSFDASLTLDEIYDGVELPEVSPPD